MGPMISAVAAVPPAMAGVEEVEQRTREEQQVRENAQGVGRVLSHDEKRRHREEREQHYPRARSDPRTGFGRSFRHRRTSYRSTGDLAPSDPVPGTMSVSSRGGGRE